VRIKIDDAIDRMSENFWNCTHLECGGHSEAEGKLEELAQAHFMAMRALQFCQRYGVDEKTLMNGYMYDG